MLRSTVNSETQKNRELVFPQEEFLRNGWLTVQLAKSNLEKQLNPKRNYQSEYLLKKIENLFIKNKQCLNKGPSRQVIEVSNNPHSSTTSPRRAIKTSNSSLVRNWQSTQRPKTGTMRGMKQNITGMRKTIDFNQFYCKNRTSKRVINPIYFDNTKEKMKRILDKKLTHQIQYTEVQRNIKQKHKRRFSSNIIMTENPENSIREEVIKLKKQEMNIFKKWEGEKQLQQKRYQNRLKKLHVRKHRFQSI